jgi:hypothetical protein
VLFFIGGLGFGALLFYLPRGDKARFRANMAWICTVFLAIVGIFLLIFGGLWEYRTGAISGIITLAAGAGLIAIAGLVATVAAQWQAEAK